MNYVKKMCILRQIKQGFSGDGKTLSGLVKMEQYGKNLAVEVSIINFAPLVSGEYYCLLSDGKGKTEMLSLRGKSIFNLLSDMDITGGFCAVICYVKTEVVPIAYGINGNGAYDWRAILNKAMPPVFPKKQEHVHSAITLAEPFFEENEPTVYEMKGKITPNTPLSQAAAPHEDIPSAERVEEKVAPKKQEESASYDDEKIAKNNYYEEEGNERVELAKANENAGTESTAQTEGEKEGTDAKENVDAQDVRNPFKRDPDGYYLSIKRELDELFAKYPADKTLTGAFLSSEWVRLRGSEEAPEFLVGALLEDGRVKYVCYALAAEDKDAPPEEIKEVCSFVPTTPLLGAKGFFVIFQSAASGECIKPTRV